MNILESFQYETFKAVAELIKLNLYMQALIILYTAIDTLAWSNKAQGDVTKKDFCDWVSTYMEPELNLGCAEEDLYAARCGLVHSHAAESKMSRQGIAKLLYYYSSPDSLNKMKEQISERDEDALPIYITDLLKCFLLASDNYFIAISSNDEKLKEVVKRLNLWLRFRPLA